MKHREIVCISASDWLKPWGSKQQLMSRLAADNRVLYVEYQASFLDFIKHPDYFFARMPDINKLRRVGANIYLYTPIPLFPFANYLSFVAEINQSILLFSLKRAMRKLNFKKPLLWTYLPTSAYLAGKIGEEVLLYHCGADFSAEKSNWLRKRTILRMENRLAAKADIVLALTRELYARFKAVNDKTFYFPSAVDIDYFAGIRDADTGEPQDISSIRRPRLGVLGYLDGNLLDVKLLDRLAKADPGRSIVMIGPYFRKKEAFTGLKSNRNVYFLGEKRHELVPHYLKFLDVCLVPYVKNKFTSNVSALKLYEYLAMGKPVVSTYFSRDLDEFRGVVGIAGNNQEFLDLVYESLISAENREKVKGRINFAADNSWKKRMDLLEEVV